LGGFAAREVSRQTDNLARRFVPYGGHSDLRSWRDLARVAGLMLAAFVAVVAQPLVYGGLGTSIVALMTPVK